MDKQGAYHNPKKNVGLMSFKFSSKQKGLEEREGWILVIGIYIQHNT